jgi:hypothetical protein
MFHHGDSRIGGWAVSSGSASSITTFAALAVPIWPAICDTEAGTYLVFHPTGYSRGGQPIVREAMRDKVVQQKTTTAGGGGGDEDSCKKLLRAINPLTKLPEEVLKRR